VFLLAIFNLSSICPCLRQAHNVFQLIRCQTLSNHPNFYKNSSLKRILKIFPKIADIFPKIAKN